jgi:hypothetical protein
MNRLLLTAAALLALTGVADAKSNTFKTAHSYHYEGEFVWVFTEDEERFEVRYIPGWKLDPKCPRRGWGADCNGGMGYILFEGSGKTF